MAETSVTDTPEHGAGPSAEAHVATVGHAGEVHHNEPKFLGFGAEGWVSVGITLFLVLVIWKKGHHALLNALDSRIQKVKDQLAEAASLRADAERLMHEMQQKKQAAEETAQAMIAQAHQEAQMIITQAQAQAENLVARRTAMASVKIATAERAATQEIQAHAAHIATLAAHKILSTQLDDAHQGQLVDRALADLNGSANNAI